MHQRHILLFKRGMDWLNSLGAATATGTGNVLRLLIHKLDLEQRL